MVTVFYDDIFLKHNTGVNHPENSFRLTNTLEHLKTAEIRDKINFEKPVAATFKDITTVHYQKYVEGVKQISENGGGMIDADTRASGMSYEAALFAAGAGISATDAVMEGRCKSAFCLVRPPGHHAVVAQGMGFCLFNNVAIAARYLQSKYNINKVLIIDWDVHHGNGTEEIFYDDDSVLYFSMHRTPFYPGTGLADDTGDGKGDGYTVNIPLRYGIMSEEYLNLFAEFMTGKAKEFEPEFIIISAGFDAYVNDPIGGLSLNFEDFETLTAITAKFAEETCQSRIVSCLEGGYNLTDLPKCIESHLKAMP